MKVAVIGPEATPPESKAIPTNNLGVKYVSRIAKRYPGKRKCHKWTDGFNILIIDKATATATPTARENKIRLFLICPLVTSSICSFNTYTAGSAKITVSPKIKPVKMTSQSFPIKAIVCPIALPASIKPALTPTKKKNKTYKSIE